MQQGYRWWVTASALVLVAAVTAPSGEPAEPTPVHADAAKLETAMLETVRAFLHEDGETARRHLDAMEKLSRRLGSPDEPHFGREMVNYDTAFHLTLDRTRELARRPELDDAFNQFVYIQRSCVACHRIERPQRGGSTADD